MSTMHEKLRNLYNKYVLNILDERARKEHNLKPYNIRLVLPGEDEDFSKMFDENEEDTGYIVNNEISNKPFKSPTNKN